MTHSQKTLELVQLRREQLIRERDNLNWTIEGLEMGDESAIEYAASLMEEQPYKPDRIDSRHKLEAQIVEYAFNIREILATIDCSDESRKMIDEWSNDLDEQVRTLLDRHPDPQGEPNVGFWVRVWMAFSTCDVELKEFHTLEQAGDKIYGAGEFHWFEHINPHLKYQSPYFGGSTGVYKPHENHDIHKGTTQRLIGLLLCLEGAARDWSLTNRPCDHGIWY